MPTRDALLQKLRDKGFVLRSQGIRVHLYRRGTMFVSVPRHTIIAVENARTILRNAGLAEDEIEEFLKGKW